MYRNGNQGSSLIELHFIADPSGETFKIFPRGRLNFFKLCILSLSALIASAILQTKPSLAEFRSSDPELALEREIPEPDLVDVSRTIGLIEIVKAIDQPYAQTLQVFQKEAGDPVWKPVPLFDLNDPVISKHLKSFVSQKNPQFLDQLCDSQELQCWDFEKDQWRLPEKGKLSSRILVSTGLKTTGPKAGVDTPAGWYVSDRHHRTYFSKSFDGAPMPFSIFFYGGIALHGTIEGNYRNLGVRASKGCVRQFTAAAEKVFQWFTEIGPKNVYLHVIEAWGRGESITESNYQGVIGYRPELDKTDR